MVRTRRNRQSMRSPEEGPSTRADPSTSGGSDHTVSDQWRGRLRAPRRGEGDVLDPEATSAPEPAPSIAERHIRTGIHRNIEDVPPVQRALPATQPATTRAGLPRQRMRWNLELNEELVRCYFIATKLETVLTAYRYEMRRIFLDRNPELSNLNEQRLADQRRAIFDRNLVNAMRRNEIKEMCAMELATRDTASTELTSISPSNTSTTTENDEVPVEESYLMTNLRYQFQKAIIEFSGIAPDQRPLLPKRIYKKSLLQIASDLNKILEEVLSPSCSFHELHLYIYCAAVALIRSDGGQLRERTAVSTLRNQAPAWKVRLDRRIEAIRQDLGRLHQWNNGNRSRRLKHKVLPLLDKLRHHAARDENNISDADCLDTLKQKLAVLVSRRARYVKSYNRRKENALFKRNERQFYRNLSRTSDSVIQWPSGAEFERYWSSVWSKDESHHEHPCWLTDFEASLLEIPSMTPCEITVNDVKTALQKAPNWRAPGLDGLHNFYYKKFTSVHSHLARHFNNFLTQPQEMPSFLLKGETYFIPKFSHSQDPESFRPITCLPTAYKILSSIVSCKVSKHCFDHGLIAEQQKGCCQYGMGCKEQLTIDSVVTGQAAHGQRNLYMAYIDFKKAFDSVPHSWILYVLRCYNVSPTIVNWLKGAMQSWVTVLRINGVEDAAPTIRIRNGIFQGDSLSALLFCLSLNPLSFLLDDSGFGFSIRRGGTNLYKLTHLLYMDDIKLYASTPNHLQQLLSITSRFSKDIRMEFGVDKCRTQSITRGVHSVVGFHLGTMPLEPMRPEEHYKYLGFKQATGTDHKLMKDDLTQEFKRRLKALLRSELNGGNLARAVNSFALPVLTYSFGVVKWSRTDLESIETSMRVLFSKNRKLHPKSAIERFFLPRKLGGRGILSVINLHNEQIGSLRDFFLGNPNSSRLRHAISEADNGCTPLCLSREDYVLPPSGEATTLINKWKQKSLHGRYPNEVFTETFDDNATHAWLVDGSLFAETEGFIMGIQDQVILTRNYRKYIMGSMDTNDNCRSCHSRGETIQHITGGCPSLAGTDYKDRHDQVAKLVHNELALKYGLLKENIPYYRYKPSSVLENDHYRLYWDRTLLSDHTMAHNRPDITLVDKRCLKGYLIDIAVPNRHNVDGVFREKLAKYAPLSIEVKDLWGLSQVAVIPVVISSTGEVPTTLLHSLDEMGIQQTFFKKLQKAVIISTCAIVRRFLNI